MAGAFLVAMYPLSQNIVKYLNTKRSIFAGAHLFAMSSSVSNPVIYGFFNSVRQILEEKIKNHGIIKKSGHVLSIHTNPYQAHS